jgi:RimJ/RimL family protein N-acetyltransferase
LIIAPWSEDDLELLRALVGDPAMMAHLGGPETDEKIAERNRRYARMSDSAYKIVQAGVGVGWVGYWARDWLGEEIYETGWSVVPAFQGRGLATAAMRDLIPLVPPDRVLAAFPSVDNAPSNGVCRKLGFTLHGARDVEYPPGHPLRVNDWRLDLRSRAPGRTRPSP